MPARPDLTELERLREEMRKTVFVPDVIRVYGELAAAAVNALPFLLAEARKVANAEYERDMHVAEGVREMKRADALAAQVETLTKERDEGWLSWRALRQELDWMHFHEIAMSDPFKAEIAAQAFAREIADLAALEGASDE